ncbi:thioesterase II family protein [Mycolicibacterium mengxianglii]|uniref:thioesterase II family protein n=1 Tax=Mycolicibacterium mengxianglii TaxID=2736649 RepID=UPI0018D1BB7B|nr:thioesterase [Mycolicibacterium mengxianglii]
MTSQLGFQPWIKRFPGCGEGAIVVFPHAGGAAAAYRTFGSALAAGGADTYIVQYPQRAERLRHPAMNSIEELAAELFDAGEWRAAGPLRLFGHCMGALVAFEFARLADDRGVPVTHLWASASHAPCVVAASARVPTTDRELLADMVALGGTDPRLLADEDFLDLLLPSVRADYRAWNRYSRDADVTITADIHAIGGEGDHRVAREPLQQWQCHTSGQFSLELFAGGHFYLNDHVDTLVTQVNA